MPSRKFYAVRAPLGPAVFETWDECKAVVAGVSGARYKSFATRGEAEAWAAERAAETPDDGVLRLYVDGSFVPSCPFAGWAVVAVRNGEKLWTMSGRTERPAESRNVDGEVEAATRAIRWLRENPQRAEIVHDYEGVARWALGEWKAKSAVARRYAADAAPLPEGLSFRHVVAHAGEVWNETADSLARGALRPGEGSGAGEGRASSAGTK